MGLSIVQASKFLRQGFPILATFLLRRLPLRPEKGVSLPRRAQPGAANSRKKGGVGPPNENWKALISSGARHFFANGVTTEALLRRCMAGGLRAAPRRPPAMQRRSSASAGFLKSRVRRHSEAASRARALRPLHPRFSFVWFCAGLARAKPHKNHLWLRRRREP